MGRLCQANHFQTYDYSQIYDGNIMSIPFNTQAVGVRQKWSLDRNGHVFNKSFYCFIKIGLQKCNFFGVKEFFSWISISKMDVKMKFRIVTKNHTVDSKI